MKEFERIVEEELTGCSPDMVAAGKQELRNWMMAEDRGKFCIEVRRRIRDQLQGDDRVRARQALSTVPNRIAEASLDATKSAVEHRRSALQMEHEIQEGYRLIRELGKGVVTFGSARAQPGEKWFELSRELNREAARMLHSTVWTGGGPGFMHSAIEGGKEAGVEVGGLKINLTNGESSFEQKVNDAIPAENVATFEFFGPRKISLVDAAMREKEEDRTAMIFEPGGFGTLDELFEVTTLKQLKKLGTKYPVPIILMNRDGFYDPLLQQLRTFVEMGTLNERELQLIKVCCVNEEALDYLADQLNIPAEERQYKGKLVDPQSLPPQPKMDPHRKTSA